MNIVNREYSEYIYIYIDIDIDIDIVSHIISYHIIYIYVYVRMIHNTDLPKVLAVEFLEAEFP